MSPNTPLGSQDFSCEIRALSSVSRPDRVFAGNKLAPVPPDGKLLAQSGFAYGSVKKFSRPLSSQEMSSSSRGSNETSGAIRRRARENRQCRQPCLPRMASVQAQKAGVWLSWPANHGAPAAHELERKTAHAFQNPQDLLAVRKADRASSMNRFVPARPPI